MIAMISRKQRISRALLTSLAMLLALSFVVPAHAVQTGQKRFASPAEAVTALHEAVKGNDDKALTAILGPDSGRLISSGDPVADKTDRERFLNLYTEMNRVEKKGNSKATLYLGKNNFPFPLPLVRKGKAWSFDTRAGSKEILNRRIGRNELAVVEVMQAYLDAQREYSRKDHDNNGVLEFARKLNSSPGKQDGLYWEVKEGEAPSPFGPLAARADDEGYGTQFRASEPEPFHGYYFKVLTKQGKNAEGGAFDYVVNGKMVLGFALVAYPAGYRSSGVMTFIVSQCGIIYEKDLGKNSIKLAREMTTFNPDKTWKKVQ
jgi:hypothetical protein